ncbi:MAG: hypothetical protein ACW99G_24060 [Candidatus Thorarchaeota archaeon]
MKMTEVREIMAEEIRELHQRTGCPDHANAIANLVGKYLASIRLQLVYSRRQGEAPSIPLLEG